MDKASSATGGDLNEDRVQGGAHQEVPFLEE